MEKHLVNWRPIKTKTVRGADIVLGIPAAIDARSRGTLLSQILAMPKKTPVLFEDAVRMMFDKQGEAFKAGNFGYKRGHYHWYSVCFVGWISSLGYHIELTGEEFESYVLTDKVA